MFYNFCSEVVKRGWKHYKSLWRTSPKHTGVMKTFGHQCYFTNRYGSALPVSDYPPVWNESCILGVVYP